jgi:dihydrofolate reductase
LVVAGVWTRVRGNLSANQGRDHGEDDLPDHLPLKGEGTLIVLTHDTAAKPSRSNVVFTDRTPQEIVRVLEARGHHEAVIIGGTQTVSEFVKSGLVDELYLVVEPVLFGAGLPLLRDVDAEYKMALMDVQKLNPHTVQLHYQLVRAG